MKTTMGLATAAVLAVGSLGVATATAATSQAAPTAPTTTITGLSSADRGDDARVAAAAVEALRAHPRAARASTGQSVEVTDTVVDPDGATHVRMERTFRGLRVLGGDLVVHQGPGATPGGASRRRSTRRWRWAPPRRSAPTPPAPVRWRRPRRCARSRSSSGRVAPRWSSTPTAPSRCWPGRS